MCVSMSSDRMANRYGLLSACSCDTGAACRLCPASPACQTACRCSPSHAELRAKPSPACLVPGAARHVCRLPALALLTKAVDNHCKVQKHLASQAQLLTHHIAAGSRSERGCWGVECAQAKWRGRAAWVFQHACRLGSTRGQLGQGSAGEARLQADTLWWRFAPPQASAGPPTGTLPKILTPWVAPGVITCSRAAPCAKRPL